MEHNIYDTPKSELADQTTKTDNNEPEFYSVAIRKFLILYVITLGIYSVYWFYKNWSYYKLRHNDSMWPVMRGIFSIFFAHSLFRKVDETIQSKSLEFSWSHAGLATLYVVCSVAANIADRLSMKGVGVPLTDYLGFFMIVGAGFALYKAQFAINLACDDPDGETNSAITPANIAWIVLGTLLWSLVLIGMLVPEGQF